MVKKVLIGLLLLALISLSSFFFYRTTLLQKENEFQVERYGALTETHEALINKFNGLTEAHDFLKSDFSELESEYDVLAEAQEALTNQYDSLRNDYEILLDQTMPPSAPACLGTISGEELAGFLYSKFPTAMIYISDTTYNIISLEEFKRFLSKDRTDELVYEEDSMDCDDFATRLMGVIRESGWSNILLAEVSSTTPWLEYSEQSFGVSHRYNLFITKEEGELIVYYVEPQSDEVIPFPTELKYIWWIKI